jgi:hypothetical protein
MADDADVILNEDLEAYRDNFDDTDGDSLSSDETQVGSMELYKVSPGREFLPVQAWEYYELSGFTSSLILSLSFSLLGRGTHALSDYWQGLQHWTLDSTHRTL